jgi:hypothetical protein
MVGVVCLAGCGLFCLAFALAISAGSAVERHRAEPWFLSSLVAIVFGLAVMIGHLRLVSRLPGEEKKRWSSRLAWLGPIAAAWYLLSVSDERVE